MSRVYFYKNRQELDVRMYRNKQRQQKQMEEVETLRKKELQLKERVC